MKNFVVLFFFVSIASAQLYVADNSYLYAEDIVVFVEEDVNLDGTNAAFYLREEAQLIQGTSGIANSGSGFLSVYQEGTTNNYHFNYWSSPVGTENLSSAGPGNLNFIPNQGLYYPLASGVTDAAAPTFSGTLNGTTDDGTTGQPLVIAAPWIFKYTQTNPGVSAYASWQSVGASGIVEPSNGFTMKGVSGTGPNTIDDGFGEGQRFDFRGRPNNGTFNRTIGAKPIGQAFDNFILVGNPYPSALDLKQFFIDNQSTLESSIATSDNLIAYFWESDPTITSHNLTDYVGGYAQYLPNLIAPLNDGTTNPAPFFNYNINGTQNASQSGSGPLPPGFNRRFLPIGQGFMLQNNDDTQSRSFEFRNSQRVFVKESDGNSFFKSNTSPKNANNGSQMSKIFLSVLMDNLPERPLALQFHPNATDGIDAGSEAIVTATDLPKDALMLWNNTEFNVATFAFDINRRIPLKVYSDAVAPFYFYIRSIENFTQDVYIYDAVTKQYHLISDGSMYKTIVNIGENADRFEITFIDSNQTLSNPDEVLNSLNIFQDNKFNTLFIYNPNMLDISGVNIYNINGQRILSEALSSPKDTYTYPTQNLSAGVYIVTMKLRDGTERTKKFIVD
ncbi:MAG: T9SS type A sorting domain-containing protein [Flavobacteriaceae bacterium]|nr:T9SS type A sorting domain-containing protein [Flavobacteriaceae bacterium]